MSLILHALHNKKISNVIKIEEQNGRQKINSLNFSLKFSACGPKSPIVLLHKSDLIETHLFSLGNLNSLGIALQKFEVFPDSD